MEELLAALGIAFSVTAIIGAIYGIFYVIRVIAEWRIFTKAGEKGWKTFIPFYNVYTEYKLTSNTKWFAIYLVLTFAAAVLQEYAGNNTTLQFVESVVNILVAIVTIRRWYCLSKAYGKGVGYTIGLILLHPFFIIGLGVGSSKYVGPYYKDVQ